MRMSVKDIVKELFFPNFGDSEVILFIDYFLQGREVIWGIKQGEKIIEIRIKLRNKYWVDSIVDGQNNFEYENGWKFKESQFQFPSIFMQEKVSLMDLFNRQPASTITPTKAAKKPKQIQKYILSYSNNQFQDDPLTKILCWRDRLKTQQIPTPDSFRLREVTQIVSDDQQQWGENFQGILINVDWDTLSFSEFQQLKLGNQLINNGIVFIWGDNNVGELFDYFDSQGFQYVENFMFVMLDRKKIPPKKKVVPSKNSLLNYFKKTAAKEQQLIKQQQPSTNDYQVGRVDKVQEIFMERKGDYFKQTQRVLYMFRKHHKTDALQLRHQRTSDAFFTIGDSWKLDWKSMDCVYKMIETLLIKANYQKGKPLQLLELWGSKDRTRKGWVTICEKKQESESLAE